MTTTTVIVGLILIFVLFTRTGRALGLLGVVILGLTFGPEIWREEHRQFSGLPSIDRTFYGLTCQPGDPHGQSPAECAAQRAKLCDPLGDKQKLCERELDEAVAYQKSHPY